MPSVWKTVRVFISSTFRDMHAERDHLIKVVFPALRERLEKYRIYLDDIDLRWGVTKEQAENDKVLDLCLQQIDECRPFFIGLLGERYGWVPTQFPASTLSSQGWVQHHAGKSVTDLEMVHGAFANPARARAFFYFRDPAALAGMPDDIRSGTFAETEPERIGQLADLKQRARQSGCPVMEPYPARWDAQAYDRPSKSYGRLVGLEAFGERVREQLWEAIKAEHGLPDVPPQEAALGPLAVELDYHGRFIESRLRVHVPRQQINDALLAFAENDATVPCLVTGPSGSGKSASLARFVLDYQRTHPDALVVPHFIGASPRSTNLREMLRRFCQVLKARLGLADEVPEDVAKLALAFRDFVCKVPPETRVLFVIDALNQLDETDRAQNLGWLPSQFSPHLKVVVSCISGSGKVEPVLEAFAHRQHVSLAVGPLDEAERRQIIQAVPSLSAKALDSQQIEQLLVNPATTNPLYLLVALEELRGFGSYERLNERLASFPSGANAVTDLFQQVIERLEQEFGVELVSTLLEMMATARRGLSERELRGLLGASGSDGELFTVLRQLRAYLLSRGGLLDFYHRDLFKAVRERYQPTAEARREAHGRLSAYFRRLPSWLPGPAGDNAPEPNARKVDELPWQLLQAGRHDELASLLLDHDFLEAKTQAGLVFDLIGDFASASAVLPGGHPRRTFLALVEEALRRDAHFIERHPSSLFQCLWNSCWWHDCPEAAVHYDLTKWGPGPLPWAAPGEKLCTWMEAWRTNNEARQPGFVWVRTLRPPALRLSAGQMMVLQGHREAVWGTCFSPDGRRIASVSGDSTIRVWDAHSGVELHCLRGHSEAINKATFSPDSKRLVSASEDKTVRIWDAGSGTELLCLQGHQESVHEARFLPDGSCVISVARDNSVRFWDASTGAELHRSAVHTRNMVGSGHGNKYSGCVSLSPDGKWVAAGLAAEMICARRFGEFEGPLFFRGHRDLISSVCFSGDELYLATGGGDRTIRIWDIATATELLCLLGHTDAITDISFSPDGHCLASASEDGTIRLWDTVRGGELFCLRGHGRRINKVAFSPDGYRVASASDDNMVLVWDTDFGQQALQLRGHTDSVLSVRFSEDGQRIASGAADKTARVWEVVSGAELFCLQGHEGKITSVDFAGDDRIVTASDDRTARVWDGATGAELLCLRGHEAPLQSAVFLPGRPKILTTANDATMRLWDSESGDELAQGDAPNWHRDRWPQDSSKRAQRARAEFDFHSSLVGHRLELHPYHLPCATVSPGCTWWAHGAKDETIRLWDAQTGEELHCLRGHEDWVTGVCFSHDGRRLASGGRDGTVRVWETRHGRGVVCFQARAEASAVAFSPDGQWIACACSDNALRIWDIESGAERACLRGHSDEVVSVNFSPDGRRVVSGSIDGTVRVWDAERGAERLPLLDHAGRLFCLSWAPDGQRIATGAHDGEVRIWNADGVEVARLAGHLRDLRAVVFSPDGRSIGTREHGRAAARIWDIETGDEALRLVGHTDNLWGLAFSPRGDRIATSSIDRTVRVWDARSGDQLLQLEGHANVVWHVAWSPDGRYLASGSADETVRVWDAVAGAELHHLKHIQSVQAVGFSGDGQRVAGRGNPDSVMVWSTINGECLLVEVSNDLGGVVEGPVERPWRLLQFSNWDLMIQSAATGEVVGCFPNEDLGTLVPHPSRPAWGVVPSSGQHLQIIQIEGRPPTAGSQRLSPLEAAYYGEFGRRRTSFLDVFARAERDLEKFQQAGQHAEALEECQRAIAVRRTQIREGQPGREEALCHLLVSKCEALLCLGRPAEALLAADEAVAGLERLIGAGKGPQPDLSLALIQRAAALWLLAREAEGQAVLARALELLRTAAATGDRAVKAGTRAVGLCRRLMERGHAGLEGGLLAALINNGKALRGLGKKTDALAAFEEAISLCRRLSDQQEALAIALGGKGDVLRELEREAEALEAYEQATGAHQSLSEQGQATARSGLADALIGQASILSNRRRHAEALTAYQQAVALRRGLAEAAEQLASDLTGLGRTLGKLGRAAEAAQAHEEASTIRARLVEAGRADLREPLASACEDVGLALECLGRNEEALCHYDRAVAIRRRLLDSGYQVPKYWLSSGLLNRGDALRNLGRHAEALQAYEEAAALRRGLVANGWDSLPEGLAFALERLGPALDSLGRHEEAAGVHGEAVTIRRRLVESGKAEPDQELAQALERQGQSLERVGRKSEALSAFDELIAIRVRALRASSSPDGQAVLGLLRLIELAVSCAEGPSQADAVERLVHLGAEVGKDCALRPARYSLASLWAALARANQEAKRPLAAIEAYKSSLHTSGTALEQAPWHWYLRQSAAAALKGLAQLYQEQGDSRNEALTWREHLQLWSGPIEGVEIGPYLTAETPLDEHEAARLRKLVGSLRSPLKVSVRCHFDTGTRMCDVYIPNVKWPNDPLEEQARCFLEDHGGRISEEFRDSIRKIALLAHENSVPFLDLVEYALNQAMQPQS